MRRHEYGGDNIGETLKFSGIKPRGRFLVIRTASPVRLLRGMGALYLLLYEPSCFHSGIGGRR